MVPGNALPAFYNTDIEFSFLLYFFSSVESLTNFS